MHSVFPMISTVVTGTMRPHLQLAQHSADAMLLFLHQVGRMAR